MRTGSFVVALCATFASAGGAAFADEVDVERPQLPRGDREERHAIYVEALGKAGPYGVGYEHAIGKGLALGAAASFAIVRDQQLFTVAPYLHAEQRIGARQALFADLGLVLVHSRVPSPVPEWDGMSDTGIGGQVSLGWEVRLVRTVMMRGALGVAVGDGGTAPFVGWAIGARL